MNDKMKDPECVKHKVKIAPHDYSKENFLASFTLQKQLTTKQIFWSQDLIEMKTRALKEQSTASRPIKTLTVEFESIPDTMCDVHFVNNPTPLEANDHFEIVINSNDDISSSDDDSLYKENIEYVEASPHDSEVVSLESSSTSPKSFLEETNTFHNSLPKFENFYFDLGEISSGSTTTHSDISLPDYEAFYFNNDHIEEISSGSTTTHSDISLSEYDLFVFDPSNDQFPPSDRSDFANEEFIDELAHIISPPEYDCFYF
nr:hypothetical protein [Tanacetum cinerariifolium]